MGGQRSTSLSIVAIGAAAAGIALNASHIAIIAGAPKAFLVAAIAGFTATLAGRAAVWRLRGE